MHHSDHLDIYNDTNMFLYCIDNLTFMWTITSVQRCFCNTSSKDLISLLSCSLILSWFARSVVVFFGRSYMFLSDILRSSIAVVSIQALLSHAANGHRPETTLTRKDIHSQPLHLQVCVYIY